MKKSKIFLTTGAMVLAVTAIFATKATKKFSTSIKTASTFGNTPNFIVRQSATGDLPMTTKNAGGSLEQMRLTIDGGPTNQDLVTVGGTSTSHPVLYF